MKCFKALARKLTAVALAGTMAVGAAGAAMTPITAAAESQGISVKFIADSVRCLGPLCPALGMVGGVVSSLLTAIDKSGTGGVSLNEINENINKLRDEINSQFTDVRSKIDENTRAVSMR